MLKSSVLLLLLSAFSVHCYEVSTYYQKKSSIYALFNIAKESISIAESNEILCKDCLRKQKPVDCADLRQMGHNISGVYKIWPMNRRTDGQFLYVYCDMETSGGGWTVIQRRGDFLRHTNYFFKDWKSYKEGFGNIEEDFWIGNDNIFALTNQKLYSVRFDVEDFDEIKQYALYDKFWIDDENLKYTLHISDFSGNAGDSMEYHNNQKFSTKDEDNDSSPTEHCAQVYEGAWWYNRCYYANLNGMYYKSLPEKINTGIYWMRWDNPKLRKRTEIKIRPKNFRLPYPLGNDIRLE